MKDYFPVIAIIFNLLIGIIGVLFWSKLRGYDKRLDEYNTKIDNNKDKLASLDKTLGKVETSLSEIKKIPDKLEAMQKENRDKFEEFYKDFMEVLITLEGIKLSDKNKSGK